MGQDDHPARVISVGYLALTHAEKTRATEKLFWGDWYDYFPWEDWREGAPEALDAFIAPGLKSWTAQAATAAEKNYRRARADICFALNGCAWDEERVLDRYELLYEAGLVPESVRDRGLPGGRAPMPGRPMLYDHRRILATAMSRLRGKLKYRPVIFELMPPEFTLLELQKAVEAIAGHRIHKQNFRRLVEGARLVEEVRGRKSSASGGRPAALFRFRQEVSLERPAPGVKVSPAGG
jgi:hypothetical protein